MAKFVTALYRLYVDLYFTYLEINPLVVTDDKIYILDLAAKVTLVYKIQGLQWSRSSPVTPFQNWNQFQNPDHGLNRST